MTPQEEYESNMTIVKTIAAVFIILTVAYLVANPVMVAAETFLRALEPKEMR